MPQLILLAFLFYVVSKRSKGLKKGMQEMRKWLEQEAGSRKTARPMEKVDTGRRVEGAQAQPAQASKEQTSLFHHDYPREMHAEERMADYRPFEGMETPHELHTQDSWDTPREKKPAAMAPQARQAHATGYPVPTFNAPAMVQAVVLSEVLGKPRALK